MDAVERANSGHPGTPMALAPAAFVLWTRFLRHSPRNPEWPDRDRFVLSCGHASMQLYALLHLTGYDLRLEELVRFRQFGSRTPGHPERGVTPGVETTTGPLGQGLGNGVGMAIAERFLAQHFNRPGYPIVDHRVWVLASDGDIMEGVASEGASLAGHLRLGKLNVIYDDNRITIEGPTALAFSEDVGRRFEAYGWHVERVEDGNDLEAVARALRAAQTEVKRPSLIVLRTEIAYPAPTKRNSAEAHGAPLGADEVRHTKEIMGWPVDRPFHVPDDVLRFMCGAASVGERQEGAWRRLFAEYARAHPQLAADYERWLKGSLPDGWDAELPVFRAADGAVATREASGKALNALAKNIPNILGGSADLGPSNNTVLRGAGDFAPDSAGRNLHFGVREHAMGACLNGMAAHGGVRPYGGTFLIFTDYMRPAIRLAAMMELPVIYVGTHDSIGLGEDGPTHQPIEQLASLRAIPNLVVIRPADATETVEAWRVALERREGPVLLALTRQKVPVIDRSRFAPASGLRRGAYVLADPPSGVPEVILIGTGSEVHIALEAWERLTQRGIAARVVSMPSWELFEAQPLEYRAAVLPPAVTARMAIEAGSSFGWARYVTEHGATLTIDRFGASAPAGVLFKEFGFTPERVVAAVEPLLKRR
ncbi:MAG: transketolase [Gemmatimonadetes bacterium]|nr:transketolase [Gemmatimonadota bacterium]